MSEFESMRPDKEQNGKHFFFGGEGGGLLKVVSDDQERCSYLSVKR